MYNFFKVNIGSSFILAGSKSKARPSYRGLGLDNLRPIVILYRGELVLAKFTVIRGRGKTLKFMKKYLFLFVYV